MAVGDDFGVGCWRETRVTASSTAVETIGGYNDRTRGGMEGQNKTRCMGKRGRYKDRTRGAQQCRAEDK